MITDESLSESKNVQKVQKVLYTKVKGVDRWLEKLSQDLRRGTYQPGAVLEVKIPKKESGRFRKLGIPCIRDRVAQTAAMLILSPIFEADLQDEQYA